jgi:hypothetical protein
MKAILTRKDVFTSKKGDKWVGLSFVNIKTGKTGDSLIKLSEYEKANLPDDIALTSKELEQYTAVDVSFDQTGRLESIAAAD